MPEVLEHALQYAADGWHVLPVQFKEEKGKVKKPPLISEWQEKATTDPATIRQWFSKWPDAGIAVHAGKSGLVVVDIDPRNGGTPQAAAGLFEGVDIEQVATLTADTAGGGQHYVFRAPDTAARLPKTPAPGVDLLAGDHYFVVAPSNNPITGQAYKWRNLNLLADGIDPYLDLEPLPELRAELTTGAGGTADPTIEAAELMAGDGRPAETADEVERVKSALSSISSNCDRDTWVRVLMALHWTGWTCAEGIAREWSEHDYPDFSEREFRDQWKSLGRRQHKHGAAPVTLGTLFNIAKGQGWTDSRGYAAPDGGLENYGDISNGYRFARNYAGKFLHCHASKQWYVWDGLRWAECDQRQQHRAAQSVLKDAVTDAFRAMLDKETNTTRDNYRHAQQAHRNTKRQDGLLFVAATCEGMSVADPSAFDADPYILGTLNGYVDLRTGELMKPDPKKMVSRLTGAAYHPEANCERWITFLHEVFEGDTDMVDYTQRVCGYALTGSVDAEKAFFLYGHGANGKSVFANVLNKVSGGYATTVGSELLIKNAKGNTGEAERQKIRLPGARLVLINEVGQADTFNDQMMKSITSRERVTTRPMYGEVFDFMPTHKMIIRGNHKPVVFDTGDGFWRRLDMIPFTRQFKPDEQDPHLEDTLMGELEGILAWMVRGAMQFAKNRKLGEPPARIRNESQEYRSDSDLLEQWIEDRCVVGGDRFHSVNGLYKSYAKYLEGLGIRPPTQPTFSKQLRAKIKIEQCKRDKVRGFRGVTLQDEVGFEGVFDDL